MSKVTTSGWEAWINQMPVQPTPGGTLHVIAKADTHSADFVCIAETIPQGTNPAILLLTLIVETGTAPAINPQDLHFAKHLEIPGQYTSIEIWHKGERIKTISEIPIIQ